MRQGKIMKVFMPMKTLVLRASKKYNPEPQCRYTKGAGGDTKHMHTEEI
jgi:hypothetical protein